MSIALCALGSTYAIGIRLVNKVILITLLIDDYQYECISVIVIPMSRYIPIDL